jgi:hypothetical protein
MPLCYFPKSFVSKRVSSSKSKTTWEKEIEWVATRGQEEERDSKWNVYQK